MPIKSKKQIKKYNKFPIERIDLILNKLKEIWLKDPDKSFTELLLTELNLNVNILNSDSDVMEQLGFKSRESLMWGTFGKSGKDPIKYIFLKDLESDHIKNILESQFQLAYGQLMKNELIKELNRRKIDTLINNKKKVKK